MENKSFVFVQEYGTAIIATGRNYALHLKNRYQINQPIPPHRILKMRALQAAMRQESNLLSALTSALIFEIHTYKAMMHSGIGLQIPAPPRLSFIAPTIPSATVT